MNTEKFEKLIRDNAVNNGTITIDSGRYDGHGATLTANVVIDGNDVVLVNTSINGTVTVIGKGAIVQNCHISSDDTAIEVLADNVILKECAVSGSIELVSEARNCLVAQNNVNGDILLRGGYNCAIVLNNAHSILCNDNTNVYVIENSLSAALTLTDNNYLICEDNKLATLTASGNLNFNGNDLTDVNARAEVGALPSILPHTNKELFVGMERQLSVRDASTLESLSIEKYLRDRSACQDVVIVPPGAYRVSSNVTLDASCSGTKIYAYGAYFELDRYDPILLVAETKNIDILGLSVGYSLQSCGQAHVLSQLNDADYIIIPSAGSVNDFANTDSSKFSCAIELVPQNYVSTTRFFGAHTIKKNDDGTMTLSLSASKDLGHIHPGDMLVCRIAGGNKHTVLVRGSQNILFRDFVLYGYAAALAVVGSGPSSNVNFVRMHNTVHSGAIIDKDTYLRYKSLECEYGVDLKVRIDEQGRYRGCDSMIGSVDAMHVMGTKEGYNVISSILEQMTDDGANQRSSSSRIDSIHDNGDGTTTLVYKGSLSEVYFKMKSGYCSRCVDFERGDTIFAYNSKGQLLCETTCLDDSKFVRAITFTVKDENGIDCTFKTELYAVTIPTADVNFAAAEGYDLTDNHFRMDNKILVDNLSRNSVGFVYDNVIIRNTRSRGILFKTRNVTAKHCTFKNLAHTGCLLSVESVWGESTIGCDAIISHCIFDRVGFINNYDYYIPLAPISIVGFSSTVSEDTLLYKNILIEGNRFKNNSHDYCININSAQNVRIINNTFEAGLRENEFKFQKVFNVEAAMNIEISGNKYSQYLKNVRDGIDAKNFKNIYGTDIQMSGDID